MLSTEPPAAPSISPAVVLKSLGLIIAFLVLMHGVVQVATFRFGHDHLMGLAPMFDLNREGNIPTWYSGAVLLITGLVLGIVALGAHQTRAPFVAHWAVLSAIFLYLSFDETMRVHEFWGARLDGWFEEWRSRDFFGGAFAHLWVLPAGLMIAVTGLGYLRFLQHLPPPTRTLFVVSGVMFVAGAVGFEMVDGVYAAAAGRRNLTFEAIVAAEESLEMFSIAIFLYAVLVYLGNTFPSVHVHGSLPQQGRVAPHDSAARVFAPPAASRRM